MKQKVDLVVYGSKNIDVQTRMALLRFGAPVEIFNLNELVDKIQHLCGSGKREIRRLTIIGHGDAFHQSVGVHEFRLSGKSHNLGDEGQIFRKILPYLAKDAVVVLGGCQVGKTDSIINALSSLLPGIKVRAFTAQQRPGVFGYLDYQGGMVESVNGRIVRRTQTNGFDAVDNFMSNIFNRMPTIPGDE